MSADPLVILSVSIDDRPGFYAFEGATYPRARSNYAARRDTISSTAPNKLDQYGRSFCL